MPQPQITWTSWVMVACLGLIWGSTFLVIELALPGITPSWLAAYRIAFATALTALIWRVAGGKLFLSDDHPWGAIALIGALSSAIPFILLSWGQTQVTSAFAGVSMAAVALIVLPLAHFLVPGERMTLRRTAGFVIGFVGVVILIGGQLFQSTGSEFELYGRVACLLAATCYAFSSVTMRRLPPVDPVGLAAVTLIFGTLIVVPFAWITEGAPPLPDQTTLFYLALLGLIPTAGANLIRVLVIRSAGPVFMSLTNYQVPVWSVVLGIVILNEPLHPSLYAALVLIIAGVGLSQYGALKRLFSKPDS